MKYKVLKEYPRFYLCESPKGYLECFLKYENIPSDKGIIIKKESDNYHGNCIPIPKEKVNRVFNPRKVKMK